MKKRILFLIGAMLLLLWTCTPIEKRQELGAKVPASSFVFTVTQDPDSDFILYLSNKTPKVFFSWDYIWGTSLKQEDTVKMLVHGSYTIRITGETAGGLVYDSATVNVTMSDPTAFQQPQWGYLTNYAVGKTWVWDDRQPYPWGNGGFQGCYAPCWWDVSMSDLAGRGVGSDQMTFDLNGGRHLTLVAATTPTQYVGTTQGTFNLTFGVTYPGWDVGMLHTTNVTIINGIQPNYGNSVETNFYILKLTTDSLILSAPEPGAGAWGTAWFWMFKPQS
ncbi:MAG: hypothetical protein ABSG89_00795 [Bacteroidales bacterium]|jgi:hypothetical protein